MPSEEIRRQVRSLDDQTQSQQVIGWINRNFSAFRELGFRDDTLSTAMMTCAMNAMLARHGVEPTARWFWKQLQATQTEPENTENDNAPN